LGIADCGLDAIFSPQSEIRNPKSAMQYRRHFRRHAPELCAVMRRVGPFTLRPQRNRFQMLVRSIVFQQISMGAARAIYARLEAKAGPLGIQSQAVAALGLEELRAAGLSRQKAAYIYDLAHKVAGGHVCLARLGRLSDERIIEELIQVKGIGRWTAQMFLIFALGRQDVFPVDDLGVRTAIQKLYGFQELPNKEECLAIGSRWSPFASIGAWYCWRYLDLERAKRD
jgi:DNA-3-methyladenine glycosylase II